MNLQFKKFNILTAILVSGLFSFLILRAPAFMEAVEGIPYGIQMRLDLPSASTENKIAIVNIDDKSISQLGPWPWPRHILAEMIDILKDNGAKLVGLDMTLSHKEPNPGLLEIRRLQDQVSTRAGLGDGFGLSAWLMERLREIEGRLDHDRWLAETIGRCGNVILGALATFGPYDTDLVLPAQSFLRKSALHSFQVQKKALNKDLAVNRLSTPIPEISSQCLGIGHLNLNPNDLMAGKTHIPLVDFRGFVIPSMPLRIASEYLASFPGGITMDGKAIRVGTKTIPVNGGAVFLKFKGTGRSFPHYSFVDILNVKKVPDVFEDKIVLIGLTAKDSGTVQTPVDSTMSSVEFTANVIEDIMTERYLRRPAITGFLEILLMGLLVFLSALTMGQMNFFTRTTVLGMTVLTVFLMSLILFVAFGIWFKTAYLALSLVTVYLVFSAKGIVAGERSVASSKEETAEMNRMLGLSLQSQGLLELAFEKLRKCPLDESMKDILYNLGLDFERKRMLNKAISVYEHILSAQESYRDLEDRLRRLQKLTAELPLGIRKGSSAGQPILTEDLPTKPTVGRYEILRELGQGAMGVVYEARDPKINRKIAIKTIRLLDEFEEDRVREVKERLFGEAQLAGKLSHPSIVAVYDVGEDYDLTYIAMELIEGKDLEQFCQPNTLLPLRRVLDIVAETADALDYAHTQGVVHRDVKPANIMILNDGRIKVMDFGIAKAVSSSHTKTGVILGTPNYMSPEQIEGHEIDGRSDIFSLGVVLFQLLTGAAPFQGKTMTELFYQITQVKHPSPRSVNPRVIKPCEQLIDKALAKNKDRRFQTAGVLAKYLRLLGTKIDAMS